MSQDQDSVDHELGKHEFGKSTDLPTVTDFGAGYRTLNLAEDNMTEALLEEEKRFQEKLRKDPLIGTVLDDKYHILEVLGFGGMSVVYKAMQEPVERLVAVKTVKFRVDERPDIWRRFEREVKTLSKLSHPNVVTVYDCVIGSDSQPYVVMDYLKGSSLDQVLLEGRLSLEQTYSVAAQICLGVGHAHRHEVIHRDIKPANIMLLDDTVGGGGAGALNSAASNSAASRTGYQLEQASHRQVKVVDFGLAKLGEDSRKLTHSGELWGSPPYMSPEQISGRECDSRSDIYSLGCVIYEMLTGKDPFWGANVYELLHCHMHNQPPTLACACPDGQFPVQLENVIAKAMAKNPVERFATMVDFKDALEQACLHPDHSIKNFARSPDSERSWSFAEQQKASNGNLQTAPTTSFASSFASPFAPAANQPAAVQGSGGNSATANHMLTYTLTVLILAACVLFAVNAGRNLERTKVRRYVPGSVTTSATFAGYSKNSSNSGVNSRQASSGGSATESGSEDLENRGQFRRGHSKAAVRHVSASTSQRSNESVKKTIKDSSPNSSIGGVDQSKFELLRRLKSPASQN